MDSSITESRAASSSTRFFPAGAIVLLAINGFLVALVRTSPGGRGTAYFLGAILGAAFVFAVIGLVVYGIARAFGKAKTGAGRAKVAFWTMAVLLIINLVSFAPQGRSAKQAATDTIVTDAERRGLQVDSDSIRHAGLGFVLPHPGSGFSASPEIQRTLDAGFADQPGMSGWAFRDPALRQAMVIQVAKLGPVNERGFREYAAGVRDGVSKSTVLESKLDWRDAAGEYRQTSVLPAGVYITMRCLARVGGAAIVCVQTMGAEPNAVEASRAGLRLIM
jgi:hypothetical protein